MTKHPESFITISDYDYLIPIFDALSLLPSLTTINYEIRTGCANENAPLFESVSRLLCISLEVLECIFRSDAFKHKESLHAFTDLIWKLHTVFVPGDGLKHEENIALFHESIRASESLEVLKVNFHSNGDNHLLQMLESEFHFGKVWINGRKSNSRGLFWKVVKGVVKRKRTVKMFVEFKSMKAVVSVARRSHLKISTYELLEKGEQPWLFYCITYVFESWTVKEGRIDLGVVIEKIVLEELSRADFKKFQSEFSE
ncbi:hypothetical protein HK098_002569 [Nowakowskiella sp. JEL0407]|nr:hypothetical protein HK098_002569 [Nowakowskiella sp. JEL0407]